MILDALHMVLSDEVREPEEVPTGALGGIRILRVFSAQGDGAVGGAWDGFGAALVSLRKSPHHGEAPCEAPC